MNAEGVTAELLFDPRQYLPPDNLEGEERARAHVRAARELGAACHHADEVVVNWVLQDEITAEQLRDVTRRYREEFGRVPTSYFVNTIDLWRDGSRMMSGLVRVRLMIIAPHIMPLKHKLQMVKRLAMTGKERRETVVWKVKGTAHPANARHILQQITSRLAEKKRQLAIPPEYKRFLKWLADRNVEVYGRLLEEIEETETETALKRCRERVLTALEIGGEMDVEYATYLPSYDIRLEISLRPKEQQKKARATTARETKEAEAKEGGVSTWVWIVGAAGAMVFLSQC